MSDGHIYSVRSVLSRVRPVHVEAHDGELLEGDGEVEGGDAGGGLQLVVAGEVADHDHPPEHAHVLHQSEVSSRRVHQSQLTCTMARLFTEPELSGMGGILLYCVLCGKYLETKRIFQELKY